MKKLALLLPILLLSGCSLLKVFDDPVPVKQKFPTVPENLKQSCPELQTAEQNEKLSEVLKTVSKNYSQYHECRILVDEWNQWYKEQKRVYEQ
jgi:hypothetical protein